MIRSGMLFRARSSLLHQDYGGQAVGSMFFTVFVTRARSSVGQSSRLIIDWSQVQVLPGPHIVNVLFLLQSSVLCLISLSFQLNLSVVLAETCSAVQVLPGPLLRQGYGVRALHRLKSRETDK